MTDNPKHTPVERLAYVRGLIVTANRDGSIPLNSKVIAQRDSTNEAAKSLVDGFNALMDENAELLALIERCADEFYDICHSSGDPADPTQTSSAAFLYRECRAAIAKAEGGSK